MSTKIDEIDEIEDLLEIMKSFGVSAKGCKGVDGMKTRLREYLEDPERSSKRKVGEVSIIILKSVYTSYLMANKVKTGKC